MKLTIPSKRPLKSVVVSVRLDPSNAEDLEYLKRIYPDARVGDIIRAAIREAASVKGKLK